MGLAHRLEERLTVSGLVLALPIGITRPLASSPHNLSRTVPFREMTASIQIHTAAIAAILRIHLRGQGLVSMAAHFRYSIWRHRRGIEGQLRIVNNRLRNNVFDPASARAGWSILVVLGL